MMNVAIVGAGTMGRVHGSSYSNVKNAKVVAVCDIEKEKATAVAQIHAANVYDNFERMLENEPIDIVDICLPTYLHKEYAIGAINLGKHVFCEKPVTLSIADSLDMLKKSNEKGVKLSVGHVVRFFPAYKHTARRIAEGTIGTVKLIRTTRTGTFPAWGSENWYSDSNLSGGVIMDLVIHDFDWIRHNFGEVERVYARSLTDKNLDRQDHCLVTLRLENGAIAHVEGSWAYPPGSVFGSTYEIIGTSGQIEFDSRASAPIKKHIRNDNIVSIIDESPVFSSDEPYTAELQDFVNCIINDIKPAVSIDDAISALRISLAAIESSRTGKSVCIGGTK